MDFTTYLPENARTEMLTERITALASEGLANQIALSEATQNGNTEQAETFASNIVVISAAIVAHETSLAE
jgi:hypothetical protein